MHRRLVRLLALGLILAAPAFAQDPAPTSDSPPPVSTPQIYPVGSEPQPEPSPVRWEGQTAILGAVRLDSATKTVSATGWVNQIAGPIEVLACGPAGKVHESVFVLPVNALDLQAALLLAGLKGGDPMPALGQGPPNGAPVDVFVDWQAGDETKTARAESFVWNVETDSVLPDAPWTFTGSVVKDGQFKALAEESLVVTYWDPYAIVNVAHPAGANDELLVVNTNVVPEVKTPVSIRFVPR
ncbi:MAG: YdjY domain-containing protein [Kiritimatiellia bacterium]